MQKGKLSLDTRQMATMAVNLLNQHLLETGRTEAKQIFRRLEDGHHEPITNLQTEDGGLIRVDCQLDCRAFVGQLNFSAFRDSVFALLAQLSGVVQREEPLQTLSPLLDDETQPAPDVPMRVFAVGGVTAIDDQVNILMLGVRTDQENPVLQLQLMYVDPSQFQTVSSTS